LFVTIELVKYVQAFLINVDLDMYYADTDTPAVCRTSSLVEELGQIEYIFSDKTGTLTCNMMQFRQASIGGIQYGEQVSEDRKARVIDGVEDGVFDFNRLKENLHGPNAQVIEEFLTLLATCHTVIPERNDEKPTDIKYQAASPDEGALVEGAAMLGYKFTTRRPKSVSVNIDLEGEKEYQVLNICEFNSTRKRMSAILRCPDGKIRIYCKGADTFILERLARDNPFVDLTTQHLEDYATEGLRTLCLAMREISEEEYRQWSAIYNNAATLINGRAEALDKAAELIEKEFYLLGATAIEDRLQEGVPETIHTLQTAGIKVWYVSSQWSLC
jgi:phospholipid-transporting ATPase